MANRLHIAKQGYDCAMHVKMEVDFTVEQDYNFQFTNIERSKIFRAYIVGLL